TAEKPTNNKIVVVNIDGNLLVKRFVQENGTVWLHSDNPAFEPIKVSEDYSFEIFGVVKRIMRSI
ncbi:MAG TPA: S24 family peptidase, partial [Candidatus Kapabacteria bacterium]|nr:S24 family peptidase [Candidatus Kapabacteria bacterium]